MAFSTDALCRAWLFLARGGGAARGHRVFPSAHAGALWARTAASRITLKRGQTCAGGSS